MSDTGTQERSQRAAFLSEQRWFAGKGRDFEVTDVEVLARLDDGLRIELVQVSYADGEPRRETYQMPVVGYPEHQDRLAHALIRHGVGEDGTDEWTYDALHDRDAMAVLYRAFTEGRSDSWEGELEVHSVAEPGLDEDADVHSTFLPAEQSNSSAVFGETAIVKVFRKLAEGHNPDIEVHAALTRAGDDHIAHLYGWLSSGEHDLAMLQQYLRTASDGWELAKNSVRNLLTEGDLHADEVGGDFGGEAHRLGVAVAAVHTTLARAFGATDLDPAGLAAAMDHRLRAAVEIVPELADHTDALASVFAAVATIGEAPAHRVHGDLHLGQTLRTSLGWKLVDFEGEPAKPLAERRLPDSPWRDVAGMIRSFHYAAASTVRDLEPGPDEAAQAAYRAEEWVSHNVTGFLAGYTEERGAPVSPAEQLLLDAYIADKAVYEAAYEARNRPAWLGIPLAALSALAGSPG
jgi:maltokinase